jgi:ectoine hydroxylase-related dioxygenase (phytanoyl-CoA dioxygenase family)
MSSAKYLSEDQVEQYHRDGYVVLESLFTPQEVEILMSHVDIGKDKGSQFTDAGGRTARLSFWSNLDGHVWGAASMCPRIINNVRVLLGEEAAFFHGKVTLKEANTGGAWEWHQDYGYWYDQGYVFPRMISAFAAIDHNTKENGCLEVLKGSHKLGRLNHGRIGMQAGADVERLKKIEDYFERVPCILSPGSVLFFHCNTLHSSGQNNSPTSHRRSFIMCYNALGNPQIGERKTFEQRPCPVGPDDGILKFAK